MQSYLMINDKGKVIGKSKIKTRNCVEKPIKPFEDDAIWNGADFIYTYKQKKLSTPEGIDVYHYLYDIAGEYVNCAYYKNGKETREHNGEISVLIPCYGKSEYVVTAVKSCLKQTQLPKAVLVLLMDDKSQALKTELENMSNIVQCFCEPQMNVCKARTYLAEKSKTDWIIFLDADDFLLRDFIKILDSKTGAFCMSSYASLSEGSFAFAKQNGETDAFYLDRKENILKLNMTALMHKDVFFDIGLDEELCLGGEDFDFLIRLCVNGKWNYCYTSEYLFVYNQTQSNSLSKNRKFLLSYYKTIVKNKDHIIKQFKEMPRIFPRNLMMIYFLEDPSLDRLRKVVVSETVKSEECGCLKIKSKPEINSDLDFFAQKIAADFVYYEAESKMRDTANVFNPSDYIAVNCSKEQIDKYLYGFELQCTTFDAIIFDCYPEDIKTFVGTPKAYIVKRNIQTEIQKKKLSNVDTVFYLLKNYSCFVKNDNILEPEVDIDNKFLLQLDNIKYDDAVKESALIVKDALCDVFALADTNFKIQKRAVTFILHKTCNMNCPHCVQSIKDDYLTDDEIFKNFDYALTKFEKMLGTDFVLQIMGGETSLWTYELQNKILERIKDYRNISIFSNGTDKKCPLYKDDRILKYRHIINWESQLYEKRLPKELFEVIIHRDDEKLIKAIENYDGEYPVRIVPCKTKNPRDLDISFIERLANISKNNIKNQHIKNNFIDISKKGYDDARKKCRTGEGIVTEVDCTTMMVRPCSNSSVEVPLDEFDLTKRPSESECEKCFFFS